MRTSIVAVALSVALASCSNYAKISETKPAFAASANSEVAAANFGKAGAAAKRNPSSALAIYLATAKSAAERLKANPKDDSALATYNFAIARIFTTLGKSKLDPWTQPLRVPSAGGEFTLERSPEARGKWNPSLYDLTPADELKIEGTYVENRVVKQGIGAPLVAVGRDRNEASKTDFALPKVYYGATAVARFDGRRCIMGFEDPLTSETVRLQGHTFPLAADYTAPLAVLLAGTNPKGLELSRLLRPQKYAETARIARLQPYDPDKTVVLVIHGLMDSPATWTPMLNALRGDAEIRRSYQFWFYSYPSGYPFPYSAAILRNELDAVRERFSLSKPMVVIGHSMGGCISHLLITDPREKLWLEYFGKPPEQVKLTPETKRTFEDWLIFRNRPEIGRVIFISTPHRGSELATNWIGRIGSSLVKAPTNLLRAGSEAMGVITSGGDTLKLKRIPNSVDTLAPNNRFVLAMNELPFVSDVPYHSIMGDRGKGGNKDRTKPISSDGVVPYWSSHVDGAQSECIVPSNHSAHQNAQAIEEVRRILIENAD